MSPTAITLLWADSELVQVINGYLDAQRFDVFHALETSLGFEYEQGRYSQPSVVFHDQGNVICLDDCARKVIAFWEALIVEFYPKPPVTITMDANPPPSANS